MHIRLLIFNWGIMVCISCGSTKHFRNEKFQGIEPIQIAINDFLSLKKQHKGDTIFTVRKFKTKNEDIIGVNILENVSKYLMTKEIQIGTYGYFPSKYIKKGKKLFLIWDEKYPLGEEMLSLLKEYKLLQDDQNGTIYVPDYTYDDAKMATTYFFCRTNLKIFKRKISNRVSFVPDLRCNSN